MGGPRRVAKRHARAAAGERNIKIYTYAPGQETVLLTPLTSGPQPSRHASATGRVLLVGRAAEQANSTARMGLLRQAARKALVELAPRASSYRVEVVGMTRSRMPSASLPSHPHPGAYGV